MYGHEYPADSIVECGFCDFTTGNQALLEKHKTVHFKKSIPCKLCRFTETNTTDLDKHYRNVHDATMEVVNQLNKCKFCTCKFIGLGAKEDHEELHLKNDVLLKCCSSSETVECPYCDNKDDQHNMISHIQSKHAAALELDGFRFENTSDEIVASGLQLTDFEGCDGIDEDEEQQEANSEHKKEFEEQISISADTVVEDSGNVILDKIQERKSGKSILSCTMCPHHSKNKPDFYRHLATMHNTSKAEAKKLAFCCSRCSFTTNHERILMSHFSVHRTQKKETKLKTGQHGYKPKMPSTTLRSIAETVFCCKLCRYKTSDKVLYVKHLKSHETTSKGCRLTKPSCKMDECRYTCSFCYHVTSTKEDYDAHCGKHTTFKCNKCSLRATKRLFVEDHIESPWGCSRCDFKTHHWLPMKSHSYSHQDQTTTLLKCIKCNFETRKPGVLSAHWLTHTTDRESQVIDNTISENELQAHNVVCDDGILFDNASLSTDDNPYECDLCACKFKERKIMDKHRALHGENGPFRLKCGKCRQSKKITLSEKLEKDKTHGYTNSWNRCPYCSYEDEIRYRMIEHLSGIHQNELEIEGYRFDEGKTDEVIPGNSTGIEKAPAQMTSGSAVPKTEDEPIVNAEFEMNIEENTMSSSSTPNRLSNVTDTSTNSKGHVACCSFCNFTSDHGSDCIRDHIRNEHVKRVFRCNVCNYSEKEMRLINEHMYQQQQPLRLSMTDETKNFLCLVCNVTTKRRCSILQHMFDKHVTEEETEGNEFSQINPHYFIEKSKIDEHGQKIFRCDICGCTKRKLDHVHQHIDEKHPPLTYSVRDSTKETLSVCPACRYTAKRKGTIRGHMFATHASEIEVVDKEKAKTDENVVMKFEEETDICQANSIKQQQRNEDNDVTIKHEDVLASLSDAYKEETQDSFNSLTEQIISNHMKDTTSENTGCSNSESAQQDKDKTQIEEISDHVTTLVPVYSESENRWCCPMCHYTVVSCKNFVELHIQKVHIEGRNTTWRCEACPYSIKTEIALLHHVALRHKGEYPPKVSEEIPCKQPGCDYKALSVDELSTHMARHLQTSMQQVMVYKCEICSFGTVSKSIFRKHRKSCTAD
nr:unnamed protein product [Callosobruchus analis]